MGNKIDKNVINTTDDEVRPSALKKFGLFLLELPGSLLSGSFNLLAMIPKAFSYVLEGMRDFFEKYKRAISIACYIALGITVAFAIAGVVMALAFPGAWAAVAGFSVLGYSIAGLVGADLTLQVALGAALVFAAADVLITPLFLAGAMIKNWCWPSEDQTNSAAQKSSISDEMKAGSSYASMIDNGMKPNNNPVTPSLSYSGSYSTNPFAAATGGRVMESHVESNATELKL